MDSILKIALQLLLVYIIIAFLHAAIPNNPYITKTINFINNLFYIT